MSNRFYPDNMEDLISKIKKEIISLEKEESDFDPYNDGSRDAEIFMLQNILEDLESLIDSEPDDNEIGLCIDEDPDIDYGDIA